MSWPWTWSVGSFHLVFGQHSPFLINSPLTQIGKDIYMYLWELWFLAWLLCPSVVRPSCICNVASAFWLCGMTAPTQQLSLRSWSRTTVMHPQQPFGTCDSCGLLLVLFCFLLWFGRIQVCEQSLEHNNFRFHRGLEWPRCTPNSPWMLPISICVWNM